MRLIIFEDETYPLFYPLTYFRPVFDLRCGFTSLAEKIERCYPDAPVSYFARHCLSGVLAGRQVNSPAALKGDDLLLVNGRVLALGDMPPAQGDEQCAVRGDTLVWARVGREKAGAWNADDVCSLLETARQEIPNVDAEQELVNYAWDPILRNVEALEKDFAFAGKKGVEPSADVSDQAAIWGPEDRVYVGKEATIQPHVTLDCTDGPIYVDDGVKIEAGTRVEGPGYIGKKSRIVGGKIREGCSIGPVCRVGGEVEESIIHGYSNKYHDGFLGHAYVGEWVNLGALTSNSDLKNDYSNVEVYVNGRLTDTGSAKVGSLIGDHTKTSIGTLLNTGAVVGVACNLVGGSEILPKYAPSFTLFHQGRFYKLGLKGMLGTARVAMERRDSELTEAMADLIEYVHGLTRDERNEIVKKSRK